MKKLISSVLLILWIIIIFVLSNQSGASSTESSNILVNTLYNLFKIDKDLLIIIVRKSAHIFEYFILFLLTYNCFKEYNIKDKYIMILFCIVCGIIDETHQLFINGRTGKLIDVFVDSIGIIIGYIVLEVAYGKKKKVKESSSA